MRIQKLYALLPVLLATALAPADEVRHYEQDGVTYAETTRTVRRFVPETRYEDRERTVYCRQDSTEYQECNRTVWTPVTEYRREARWHGRWNPFVQPYLVDHLVPVTRWEQRVEVVRIPTVRSQLVPQTRTERVAIVTQRPVEEQVVVSRVVVPTPRGPDPFDGGTPAIASRARIGGVARMESDPPRQGTNTEWRASDRESTAKATTKKSKSKQR